MFYLVGMGLSGVNGLSLEAANVLRQCDKVFLEVYTNVFNKAVIDELSKLIGNNVKPVNRKFVEEEKELIEMAASSEKGIALVVSGDSLIATTHINLLIACENKKIKWRVLHGVSIYSAAIGLSGLHIYKFGPSVTLSFWYDRYKPIRTYEIILENRKRGLHTLVLFDIKPDGSGMDIKTAINILNEMIKAKGEDVIPEKVLLMSNLARKEQKIVYAPLDKLKEMNTDNIGMPPYVLIIPGELHYLEEEWLNIWKL